LGSPAGLRRAKAEAKAAASAFATRLRRDEPKSRPRDEGGPSLCPAPRSGFGSASQLWASATSKQARIARLPPNTSDLRRSAAASVPRLGSPAGLRRTKAEAKAAGPKSRPRDEGGPPLCPAPRPGFGSASQLWASATSRQARVARLPPNISDLRSQRSRLRPALGLTRGTTAGQGGGEGCRAEVPSS
jgi:hypothetical protein